MKTGMGMTLAVLLAASTISIGCGDNKQKEQMDRAAAQAEDAARRAEAAASRVDAAASRTEAAANKLEAAVSHAEDSHYRHR
jgi:outer membrane murein-binding lipoprotein Lpp